MHLWRAWKYLRFATTKRKAPVVLRNTHVLDRMNHGHGSFRYITKDYDGGARTHWKVLQFQKMNSFTEKFVFWEIVIKL